MQRIIFTAVGLALAGLVLDTNRGTAQTNEPGPTEGGSVLKDPFAPSATPPGPSSGKYVEDLIKQTPMGNPYPNPADRQLRSLEAKPDINQDIQVTKELGPWMIMVHAYSGPEAALMARQMVQELRTAYALHAYTFNYGAEEKRKEFERVKAIIDKQKEYLAKNNMPLDQPIRVRTMRIEEQVGVLVGGYANEEAARRALDSIRKLKTLDPHKVMLDKKVYYIEEKKKESVSQTATKAMEAYVNPFLGAFVAHNPEIKQQRPADWDKPDIGLLQKLNAGEKLSLLNCKKAYTLVVKDFQTPTMLQQKDAPGSFLENLTGGKSGQRVDAAAVDAHNFAELLRKAKLDAYVLHTKYFSIVCVGGYDSPDDPNLRIMKNLLETKVMPQIYQFLPAANPAVGQGTVFPIPIPR